MTAQKDVKFQRYICTGHQIVTPFRDEESFAAHGVSVAGPAPHGSATEATHDASSPSRTSGCNPARAGQLSSPDSRPFAAPGYLCDNELYCSCCKKENGPASLSISRQDLLTHLFASRMFTSGNSILCGHNWICLGRVHI